MKLRLDLRLGQKLIMTPQLQQAIKLLQLSRLELQQTLSQQLLENPLLEDVAGDIDEPDGAPEEEWRKEEERVDGLRSGDSVPGSTEESGERNDRDEVGWEEYFGDDQRAGDVEYPSGGRDDIPSYEQTAVKPTSLQEHLLWQLALSGLSDDEKFVGKLIIGNLDDDGYLRISLDELANDAKVNGACLETVLSYIQTFDPSGVGARDLRECLLIQLGHLDRHPMGKSETKLPSLRKSLVATIVSDHLVDLEKKHYGRLAKSLGVSLDAVYAAVKVIEGLEPKPGRPFFASSNYAIIPDVFVRKHEGEWEVALNDDGMPRLRVSPYYRRLLSKQGGDSEATKLYLDEKLRGAQWLIRSIEQRNRTIIKVVSSIVKFQEPFFEKGVRHLKPLVLRQVAEDIGMHESTISRVTAGKYVCCPQGVYELKYFFSAGIQQAGDGAEMLSAVSVRDMIRRMVGEEDARRPLKDQEIVARLRSQNIVIARRTVAKYRSEENIPSANQRRRVF
jgi:RNA polymerase sigma-54 factor